MCFRLLSQALGDGWNNRRTCISTTVAPNDLLGNLLDGRTTMWQEKTVRMPVLCLHNISMPDQDIKHEETTHYAFRKEPEKQWSAW